MSVLLPVLRDRVRIKLRQTDSRLAHYSPLEIDMAICDAYISERGRLPAPMLYTANAFTIAAGADTFTLPVTVTSSGYGTGTEQYTGLVRIQLVSNGIWLADWTNEMMDVAKAGQVPATNTALGKPDRFALYETNAQGVNGRVYPGAAASEACNTWTALAANDLRNYVGTGGTEGLDTAPVLVSTEAATALEWIVSSTLGQGMPPEALQRCGLNPAVFAHWEKEGRKAMYKVAEKRFNIDGIGQTERWVS